MTRRRRCSSWPAAPAAMCSRRWPWRSVLRERGVAGGLAGRARRHGGAAGAGARISDRVGARQRAFAARALLAWLLAPLRICQRCGAGHARCCAACGRARCSGAGGFVSGPGGIAAWLLRIPLLIHEQNAIAGLDQSLAGAPRDAGAARPFRAASAPACDARTIGNPVRADIAALPPPRAALRRRASGALAPAGLRRQPGRAAR